MVDVGTGFVGIKRSFGLWTNKLLMGGSGFIQTAGAVGEWAISGTQSTLWVSGTISGSSMIGTVQISGAQILTPGSVILTGNLLHNVGSPYTIGQMFTFTTRSIITGGMWVDLSGAQLAFAAATSTDSPIGYCLTTVGSNATANVITNGIVPFIAEATIEAGDFVNQGAAGALNGVVGIGSPNYARRGIAVSRALSGGTLFVYLCGA